MPANTLRTATLLPARVDITSMSLSTCEHRECAQAHTERLCTCATAITLARTIGTLLAGLLGAREHSLALLLSALAIYWVGDVCDGLLARYTHTETRIGATLDIMCDRISAGVFYVGFAWFDPTMIVPIGIYLVQFMVVDMYLSLAFSAWPVSSPNYFHVIDRKLWLWNWSKRGKALNSALFALLMIATRLPWLAGFVAAALLCVKLRSLLWLLELRVPVPSGCALANAASPQ